MIGSAAIAMLAGGCGDDKAAPDAGPPTDATTIDSSNAVDGVLAIDGTTAIDAGTTDAPPSIDATPQRAALIWSANGSSDLGTIINNGTASTSAQTFTVANHGTGDATNVAISITGQFAATFNIQSNTCGIALAPTGTCTIAVTFGPSLAGADAALLHTLLVANYNDGVVDTFSNTVLTGTIALAGSAVITTSLGDVSGFGNVGDGSQATPFLVDAGTTAQVAIVYTNSGTASANLFETVGFAPAGWLLTHHGCDGATLDAGDTCTDTYSISPVSDPNDFAVADRILASWYDSSGDYPNQSITGLDQVFVSVTPPTLTLTTRDLLQGTVMQGFTFTATITLVGGLTVNQQFIFGGQISPFDPGFSVSPNDCEVSSSSRTCDFVVTVGSAVSLASYEMSFEIESQFTLSPNVVDFTVIAPLPTRRIFVTNSTFTGNMGGFSGADTLCNADSNKPSGGGTYKALLVGNNATTAGVPYVNTNGDALEVATGGDLVGLGFPLFNGFPSNGNDDPWTGAAPDTNGQGNCQFWTSASAADRGHFGYPGSSSETNRAISVVRSGSIVLSNSR